METKMGCILWLVIPCYNEEAVLEKTIEALTEKLKKFIETGIISSESRMLFVDDGSRDDTWNILKAQKRKNSYVHGIRLAHNRGHQNALMAGMTFAMNQCDCLISLDADLQDDIDVLKQFIEKYNEGNDIVYGVRRTREKDSFFKRNTAMLFYKFMNVCGIEIVSNHADYRLLSNKAVQALSEYDESNLFLRGMVPLIGMKHDYVYYDRHERIGGVSKYSLRKMCGLALDGITSFSVKPLRIISVFGILFSIFSVWGLVYALVSFFCGVTVPGWTAIVCSIWLIGGIQLLCIGILGEYIGKIYSEVKHRPRYFVEEEI
jgi:glycosyltransferase involved in cell wall biosynthesis